MSNPGDKLLQVMMKRAAAHRFAPRAIARAFMTAEESFATPLLLLVLDMYGHDALSWTPETLRMELEEDLDVKIPKVTIDKIMAAITIVTTNYFFKDVTRFIELCNVLAGDDFQPDEFEPADVQEVLWGITEASLLWPPDAEGDEDSFSPEIKEYLSQVLRETGVLKPFNVLRLAFDGDQSTRVNADWADDPEMYTAIYESQQQRQDDMEREHYENLNVLRQQLQLLQLDNGSVEQVVQSLDQLLGSQEGVTNVTY